MWKSGVLTQIYLSPKKSEPPRSILKREQTWGRGGRGWEGGTVESRGVPKPNFAFSTNFLYVPGYHNHLLAASPNPDPQWFGYAEVLMSLQMLPSLVELLCLTKLGLQQLLLPGPHTLQQNFLIWKSLFHPIWAERIQSHI